MIKDDWDSVSGDSSKDELLRKIETYEINLLLEYLERYKKSYSYLESYIADRKREFQKISNKNKDKIDDEDEIENSITDTIMNAFATKKLSKEREEELSSDAYIWYNLKDDPTVIKKLEERIDDLEYDEEDEDSRAIAVRAMSKLTHLIPDNEKWSDIKESVIDQVEKFDFADLILFRNTCGSYYIFREKGYDQILLNKIPDLSAGEMYYYLISMSDNGDGNTPEFVEAKKRKIMDLNSNLIYTSAQLFMKDFNPRGFDKISYLNKLKIDAHNRVPWRIYDSEEEQEKNLEEDRRKDNEIMESSESYQEYIERLNKLSTVEFVQLYACNIRTAQARVFYEREADIFQNKMKDVSRKGVLVLYASYLKEKERVKSIHHVDENELLIKLFKEKGLMNEDGTMNSVTNDELNFANNMSNIYSDMIDQKAILMDWKKLGSIEDMGIKSFDSIEIESKYCEDYKKKRNEIESKIDFIDNCVSLDKCKDIQLVNIINKMNKSIEKKEPEDQSRIYSLEDKPWLIRYLKRRILSMNEGTASLLNIIPNGEFNDYIETAIDQQDFRMDRDKKYNEFEKGQKFLRNNEISQEEKEK